MGWGFAQMNNHRGKTILDRLRVKRFPEARSTNSPLRPNLEPAFDRLTLVGLVVKTTKLKNNGRCRNQHGVCLFLLMPMVDEILHTNHSITIMPTIPRGWQKQRSRLALLCDSIRSPILASGLPNHLRRSTGGKGTTSQELQKFCRVVQHGWSPPALQHS